ncbi:hypothetical protein scyTo_0002468 [Scyliorhinus torazame]|uniref:Phosphatidylinositol transfer protein N-terminal domain-containing protein n=1 Tax=Scyliorhinus torazame TaxID=75743 RepID=A0A401PJP9_SCYTO|nr:hypothetical protein [Scyliorhinus torazame]
MPLTVEEYRIGQLYTISKHSHEQSDKGEGVEVVKNEPHDDPVHGKGQFTEKRVHLSSKLPSWARAVVPRIFYITEKAWNYYPYTITGMRFVAFPTDANVFGVKIALCSFLPKFSIYIETKYEDNNGCNNHIFDSGKNHTDHEVCFLDIAYDEIPDRYYKSSEDLRYFASVKTGRGPLKEGWRDDPSPVMCSYKQVTVKFEVWGLQTRVEQFVQKVIRDILLIGHRQAFAWVDEWCGIADVGKATWRVIAYAGNLPFTFFNPGLANVDFSDIKFKEHRAGISWRATQFPCDRVGTANEASFLARNPELQIAFRPLVNYLTPPMELNRYWNQSDPAKNC